MAIHPDYLLRRLTIDQLDEWLEYYKLEPFGFVIEDARFGVTASVIARSAGADLAPSTFMFNKEGVDDETPPEEGETDSVLMGRLKALLPPGPLAPPPPPAEE